MDILRYETVFAWISNELNSVPLCLGNNYRDMEHTDLITPSRLVLGRNNRRAVCGLNVTAQPNLILQQIDDIEKAWWEVWLTEKLRDLVPRPGKWRTGCPDVKIGDVIIFVRDKTDIGGLTWRLGQVDECETGRDGVCRRVTVKYKNPSETVYRFTKRSVRDIAVLSRESELDLAGKLSRAQKEASVMMCLRDIKSHAQGAEL